MSRLEPNLGKGRSQLRLAMVVNRFPTLSETFLWNKARALAAAGVAVTVITHDRSGDWATLGASSEATWGGRVVHALTADKSRPPLRAASRMIARPLQTLHTVRRSIAAFGPTPRALRAAAMAWPFEAVRFDVVHFEYSGLAVAHLDSLPLLEPAKLVASCRGAAEQITPRVRPERVFALRSTLQRMDAVHCVSDDMRRTIGAYGIDDARLFVNRPAIRTEMFSPSHVRHPRSDGHRQVLSVGRLHWKKGYEQALLAVRDLTTKGVELSYLIIGGGSEEEKLRFMAADLGIAGRVTFDGPQPPARVRQALLEADAFVLPSLSEGLSNAALEAMAMEVPVVATSAGGMDEAIRDGYDGFLVPPYDAASLGERLRAVLVDPGLGREVGRRGRERVLREFTLERQTDAFLGLYDALLQGGSLSPAT